MPETLPFGMSLPEVAIATALTVATYKLGHEVRVKSHSGRSSDGFPKPRDREKWVRNRLYEDRTLKPFPILHPLIPFKPGIPSTHVVE
jgi:hypothetical protein